MPVREAGPADVAEIAVMVREHAEHEGAADLCRFDERSGGEALFGPTATLRALIAFPGGEPQVTAGCTLWYPTFSSWAATRGAWVEDLYVRPRYRRNGLGREMLLALRTATPGRIEWDVHVSNEAARQFYLRLGALAVTEWTKFRWSP
ncbi:MAG TPA: GNAT family N-acetyltransferase [Acidimicrobiales bacterium]|nr:GNAT family N-acetyltransferase [Acidimicrobiales bacterium]